MSIRERLFLRQVRHVRPDLHDPWTAAAREAIRRDAGEILPPFLLHLPAPAAFSASWAIVSEPTRGPRVDRAMKEAVAAAVSATNTCPYCVDVHTTMLQGLGDRLAAGAIASGGRAIADPALGGVVAWARATRQPRAAILGRPPFPAEHGPELIGVALAYHYLNRMVNIFAAGSPFPLRSPRAKPILRSIASPVLRGLLARKGGPGASLELLPAARVPDDLTWARGDPIIADAFARAGATLDALGERLVAKPVRQLVIARLREWQGEEPGLSRGWAERAIDVLPPPHRASGRLALLAALASHQVDGAVLEAARARPGPAGDETLVATAAWASFGAARRVGSWLATGVYEQETVA